MSQTQEQASSVSQDANNEQQVSGYSNIIKKQVALGAKLIKGIRVKNVNFTEKDNYTMISFTLATPVRGFVSDDGGVTFKDGMTNTIYTSLFAITGAMKEDEELSWMANSILNAPQALNLILNGSTIDILQQSVAAGEEYRNPFSSNQNAEAQVYDHDVIINNITAFTLGKIGQKMADKIADKLIGDF